LKTRYSIDWLSTARHIVRMRAAFCSKDRGFNQIRIKVTYEASFFNLQLYLTTLFKLLDPRPGSSENPSSNGIEFFWRIKYFRSALKIRLMLRGIRITFQILPNEPGFV
jgi:hypothetical protein